MDKNRKRFLIFYILSMIFLVSFSMAACPHAMNNLYAGKCGTVLEIPAPGILENDVKDAGKTLEVVNPKSITIDPKYGTIEVNGDGSFRYEAAANIASGTYIAFYYRVSDGSCISAPALVKIQVYCKCQAKATNFEVSEGTLLTNEDFIAHGAGCLSCGDVTPKFDISKLKTTPGTYPYTVICPGCQKLTGYVTVRPICPLAIDDAATTLQGMPVIIDVLVNDEDKEGATICDVQSPTTSGGTAIVSNNMITYAPGAGFCGPETFTYKLCKSGCEPSAPATVTLDVECPLRCIRGEIIDDITGMGLAGWTVTVTDSSGSVYDSVTDVSGTWQVCDLEPGNYQVCEDVQPGWIPVTPDCLNVALGGSNRTGVDFRNDKLLCIRGEIIDDITGMGLAGWTVTVTDSSGSVYDSVTDVSGTWQVCDLEPGNYQVCEDVQPGWIPVTPDCLNVALGGSNRTGVDFRNDKLLCIRGEIIDDITGMGLAGWTVTVTDSSGSVYDSVTDVSGTWQVCDLEPGNYQVCEDVQPGWIPVTPDCLNVALGGSNRTGVDFRNNKLLCIRGEIIDDITGMGLAGWTVTVTDSSGSVYDSVTDVSGTWQVCDLEPGNYQVCEDVQPGWIPVTPDCLNVALGGSNRTGVDFRNNKLLCIRGEIIDDITGMGLAGWTVTVTDSSGSVYDSVTDVSGTWQVCDLEPGNYQVCEDVQPGWIPVTPDCLNVALGGSNRTGVDFRNNKLLCIRGEIIDDITGMGLAGWTVTVTDSSGSVYDSVTDVSGTWQVCDLEPGNYQVCEDVQPGWIPVTPDCLNVALGGSNRTGVDFRNVHAI